MAWDLHSLAHPVTTYTIVKKIDGAIQFDAAKKGFYSTVFYVLSAVFAFQLLSIAGRVISQPSEYIEEIFVSSAFLVLGLTAGYYGMIDRTVFDQKKNQITASKDRLAGWLPLRGSVTTKYPYDSIKGLRVFEMPDRADKTKMTYRVYLRLEGKGIGLKWNPNQVSPFAKKVLSESEDREAELKKMVTSFENSASVSLVEWVSEKEAYRVVSDLERHLRLDLVDQFRSEMDKIKTNNDLIDRAMPRN